LTDIIDLDLVLRTQYLIKVKNLCFWFSVGWGKFLELNFANIQSFGPSKRSPEQQKSGLFYVP
jgi:hypothetical protein